MPIITVNVMPKAELLDPQGKAVAGSLQRLGYDHFTDVRIGKRIELHVDGEVTDDIRAAAERAATDILSNDVIEDVVSVEVAE